MSDNDNYFRHSNDWEIDEARKARRSEKRAWCFAAGGIILAILEACALNGLIPLKTVEAFVIRVNETTGVVDVVKSMKDAQTTYEEVVRKADLRRYVRARESYSRTLATMYYNTVGLMSSPEVAQRYQEFFNPKMNAKGDSPLTLYGDVGSVGVKIKSVSFITQKASNEKNGTREAASVNYIKRIFPDQLATTSPEETEWVATITYRYVGAPTSDDDREINPFGFQVLEYRNDPVSPNKNEAKP